MAGEADGEAADAKDADAPAFLLGHCCSIITDMCVPPGSSLLVTSDRDHKVSVSASNFPRSVLSDRPDPWTCGPCPAAAESSFLHVIIIP